MEAARAERKKLEAQNSAPGGRTIPPKTEIIREYLLKPIETKDAGSITTAAQTDESHAVTPATVTNVNETQNNSVCPDKNAESPKESEAKKYIKNAEAELEKLSTADQQNLTENVDKCAHLPLKHKPNILDEPSGYSDKKIESPDDNGSKSLSTETENVIQNNISKKSTPAAGHSKAKVTSPKLVTYTNSQNVGITCKAVKPSDTKKTPDESKLEKSAAVTCEPKSTITEQTPLKYTSSLKVPKESYGQENVLLYSTIDGSTIVHKCSSTDSVNRLELVETSDTEENTNDCSGMFKSRKVRKKTNPNRYMAYDCRSPIVPVRQTKSIPDKKSLVVSIIDNSNLQQPNDSISTRTILLPSETSRDIPATIINVPECKLFIDEEDLVQKEKSVILDVTGEDGEQKPGRVEETPKTTPLSIKDEVDPIPRPERTESVRHKWCRSDVPYQNLHSAHDNQTSAPGDKTERGAISATPSMEPLIVNKSDSSKAPSDDTHKRD